MNATTNKNSIYILIPGTEGRTLTDRQIDNRIAKLEALDAEMKRMEAEQKALKDEIQKAMGDAEHVTTGKYKVNWTWTTSARVDTTRLKKERPEIAEEFLKETRSRRFSYSHA